MSYITMVSLTIYVVIVKHILGSVKQYSNTIIVMSADLSILITKVNLQSLYRMADIESGSNQVVIIIHMNTTS